jgi:hypothetical protein
MKKQMTAPLETQVRPTLMAAGYRGFVRFMPVPAGTQPSMASAGIRRCYGS